MTKNIQIVLLIGAVLSGIMAFYLVERSRYINSNWRDGIGIEEGIIGMSSICIAFIISVAWIEVTKLKDKKD